MNPFKSVADFFVHLWTNEIEPVAENDLEIAQAFFKAAFTDAGSQLKAEGLKIVSGAVAAAEKEGGTGEEKLEAAIEQATADLLTDSITVAAHILHAAIEAAVAQMNAAKASGTLTVSAT